ncbi:diaminopimelate epimerase [Desulforhabdus amnigena]|uniref:Diaminopimelate epimerase n=1 Tax=Desulforhabdus amnigena TaxID=40218 RepID=A0A9W6D1D5_9BACT|nr:diaminopimelate epimerase [Desulforhabdus amnigena]NLJ29784.1 diaminopimelate epimerase [Deltaproteobacteria bacterium]GLI33493.1 diaminopimelate epimerase [Desulforhabdus amnigena]
MEIQFERRIHFTKMTGSGNDFIIIDNRDQLIDADNCRGLVSSVCRRKLSVGADGLILIENDPEVDFKWRFFNADGGEAEMCGNGARCAARFAYLKGIASKPSMAFRTIAGIIEAEIKNERVKIRMTPPHSLKLDFFLEAGGTKPFCLQFINTGVPHVVHFVEDDAALDSADVFNLGRTLRYHSHFQPAGTNVNFARVHAPHSISVRTYERGVEDETLACGTGSIAVALVASAKGLAASPVDVKTRSGETLTIYFEKSSNHDPVDFREVYLEGDAKVVYEAELWDETLIQ